MHRLSLGACLAFAALAAMDLEAQRGGRGGGQAQVWALLKKNHDKNNDGKISADEYTRGEDKFKTYDSDGDGVLTQADFERGGGRSMRRGGGRRSRGDATKNVLGPMISKHVDTDGDGKVSEADWKKWSAGLDKDQDGSITQAEFPKMAQAAAGRQRGGRQRGGRQRGGRGGGGGFAGLSRALDADRDGVLQTAELAAAFAKLDGNKDGTVTTDEALAGVWRLPQKGEWAPDFDLPTIKQFKTQTLTQKSVKLSSFRGAKPVALIFGSYT